MDSFENDNSILDQRLNFINKADGRNNDIAGEFTFDSNFEVEGQGNIGEMSFNRRITGFN